VKQCEAMEEASLCHTCSHLHLREGRGSSFRRSLTLQAASSWRKRSLSSGGKKGAVCLYGRRSLGITASLLSAEMRASSWNGVLL